MNRPGIPRLRDLAAWQGLPGAAQASAPGTTAHGAITRRAFLKLTGLLVLLATTPLVRVERGWARARGRFFTRRERATLKALCDTILPPGADGPGGAGLGAPRYIEHLLTAFGRPVPRIFAGGPWSGRTPFARPDGTPSHRRPRDEFKRFLPLTRTQEIHWRAELYGSTAVYGDAPSVRETDAALGGPLRGLRDIYREGLRVVDAEARAEHGVPFARLDAALRETLFARLDAELPRDPRRGESITDIVIAHTIEGALAAPEYGGNRRRLGWKLVGIEGDSQPLGYSLFDTTSGTYRERPEAPMSTPNPDELAPDGSVVARALTPEGSAIQESIATLASLLDDSQVRGTARHRMSVRRITRAR